MYPLLWHNFHKNKLNVASFPGITLPNAWERGYRQWQYIHSEKATGSWPNNKLSDAADNWFFAVSCLGIEYGLVCLLTHYILSVSQSTKLILCSLLRTSTVQHHQNYPCMQAWVRARPHACYTVPAWNKSTALMPVPSWWTSWCIRFAGGFLRQYVSEQATTGGILRVTCSGFNCVLRSALLHDHKYTATRSVVSLYARSTRRLHSGTPLIIYAHPLDLS